MARRSGAPQQGNGTWPRCGPEGRSVIAQCYGPFRPLCLPQSHRHACSPAQTRVIPSDGHRPRRAHMSIRPQRCTQLGTDSHGCSYRHGSVVTSASSAVFSQVRGHRTRSVSPHAVDNPGGGASCRPVDEAIRCAQHRWTPRGRMAEAPVPGGDEGVTFMAVLQEARPERARGGGRKVLSQRQRIDMTSPATMAPKPMAKFHAPTDTMTGMRSPAT